MSSGTTTKANTVRLNSDGGGGGNDKRHSFQFDHVFGEGTTNQQVYDCVAKDLVQSAVVDGLNACLFCYGQTSSGKTFTMQGAGGIDDQVDGGGILHMASHQVFDLIRQHQQNPHQGQDRLYLVRVSFLELYNEQVRDMLDPTTTATGGNNKSLTVRDDGATVQVPCVEEVVTDATALLEVLARGEKNRTVAATGMNERSSRSHTIVRITVESREVLNDDDCKENSEGCPLTELPPTSPRAVRMATLNLVDLAGSESVKHTGATGDRRKEGGLINQSLLALSRVISARAAASGSSYGNTTKQAFVNYRDSKLTRLLRPALSGDARMAVVCCATPSTKYVDETKSTLQFAARAKMVKTQAQVNEVLDDRSMIRRLQQELEEVKKQLSEQKVSSESLLAVTVQEKQERWARFVLNARITEGCTQSSTKARRRKTLGTATSMSLIDSTNDENNPPHSPTRKRKVALPASPKTTGRPTRIKSQRLTNATNLSPGKELSLVHEALAVQKTRRQEVDELRQVIQEQNTKIHEKDATIAQLLQELAALKEENQVLLRSRLEPEFEEADDENAPRQAKPERLETQTSLGKSEEEDLLDNDVADVGNKNELDLVAVWKRFAAVECTDGRLKSAWATFERHFSLYVVWSHVFDMPKNWWPTDDKSSPANRIRYTYADRSDSEKGHFDEVALGDFGMDPALWERTKAQGDIKKFTGGIKRRSKQGRLPLFQIVAEREFEMVEFLDELWPDRTLIRTEDENDDDE